MRSNVSESSSTRLYAFCSSPSLASPSAQCQLLEKLVLSGWTSSTALSQPVRAIGAFAWILHSLRKLYCFLRLGTNPRAWGEFSQCPASHSTTTPCLFFRQLPTYSQAFLFLLLPLHSKRNSYLQNNSMYNRFVVSCS